ncbi:hypothetical protein SAMD00019534_032610 [Acytostelium subglobosum LB1]|uniref:hypothetical protein n=1 Tax=Acytostelium subglobosum LB1 TaxID=1410327 RepID=UPI000644BE04|nr:hypothetical protein SAMD00019534_032610 [Acytostelium subglobosum LB1]GAM20086.1 hypothetical protein SAMD00019534_032610 [Acytostelium subglobosum LB1]|eukprot:XP_012756848.1 hypothetical protein SAMD00019534_032610 [Acytostelium subglobosum LB1]
MTGKKKQNSKPKTFEVTEAVDFGNGEQTAPVAAAAPSKGTATSKKSTTPATNTTTTTTSAPVVATPVPTPAPVSTITAKQTSSTPSASTTSTTTTSATKPVTTTPTAKSNKKTETETKSVPDTSSSKNESGDHDKKKNAAASQKAAFTVQPTKRFSGDSFISVLGVDEDTSAQREATVAGVDDKDKPKANQQALQKKRQVLTAKQLAEIKLAKQREEEKLLESSVNTSSELKRFISKSSDSSSSVFQLLTSPAASSVLMIISLCLLVLLGYISFTTQASEMNSTYTFGVGLIAIVMVASAVLAAIGGSKSNSSGNKASVSKRKFIPMRTK